MSQTVVIVAGSPSSTSRSAIVAGAFAAELQRSGLRPLVWSLSDFDPADVLFGRAAAPALARFVEEARSAAAIVLATPVYKAAYTGALKAIVDVIPPDALVGRPAVGIATARLPAHRAEVDRAFRALFAFFEARPLDTLFLVDAELRVADGAHAFVPEAEQRVRDSARALAAAAKETAGAASPS
jgi:FMN reductase